MRSLRITLPLILCWLVLAGLALAQGERGTITGSVTDPTGAVIPDATITATALSTGVKYTAKTSSAGFFNLPAVPPTTYRVEAKKEGFRTGVSDNLAVDVATVVTVNFALQVGKVTEEVTVSAEAPLLTPSTPEVAYGMTTEEIENLPLDLDCGGRQLQDFIFNSLPGAVGNSFAGSINGGQVFSSEILIDGISIARYDLSGGSLVEFTPAADAAGEFKVQMTNFSAAFGETGGGVNNFVMKSGGNAFHGSVYEYFKNPHLNATSFHINSQPAGSLTKQKEPLRENNFGGTLGGPIRKNKTFFFASYQGDRQRDPVPGGLMTMPTAAMRQGDFSAWLTQDPRLNDQVDLNGNACKVGSLCQVGTDALNRPVYFNEIFDPTTTHVGPGGVTVRDPFPQMNLIPPTEFSKATSQLLPLYPNPISGNLFRNYPSISTCCPQLDVNIWSGKIDHVINDKHRLSSFFNYNDRPRFNSHGTLFPPFPDFPLEPTHKQDVHGRIFRLAEDWTINDHTLNHVAIGFNRFTNPNGFGQPSGWNSKLGITGVGDECLAPMHFKDNFQLSTVGGDCMGFDPSESHIYTDQINWVHGKHNLSFGTEIRRYRYNVRDVWGDNGTFTFRSIETGMPGFASQTGHPFASFVLGAVDSGNRNIYTTTPGYRSGLTVFYVQDDFKTTRKLTLNLGLRWEMPWRKTEAFSRMAEFDPTVPNPAVNNYPGALVFAGHCTGCNGRTSFQDGYHKELAPRIGIAYAATPKLALRGGYGISFGPPVLNNFGAQTIYGFNGSVPLIAKTGPTGFKQDPVIYLTPLAGAPLPAAYQPGNGIGVPAFTGTLPVIDPTVGNNNGVDFLPPDTARQPYVQNWSLGFQYQLPAGVLLEANYVGSKGTRLLQSMFSNMFNQVPSKYNGLGDILADDFATDLADPVNGPILKSYGVTSLPYANFENSNSNPVVGQGLRPFPQYQTLTNDYPELGSSTYHALQLTVRKRSTHGLDFIAAYTLSKTLANTDTALYYPSGGAGIFNFGQDYYNRKNEKSIAGFDFPQVIKLTWIYELPFGQGHKWASSSGHLNKFVSGWRISAFQQYFSGDPLALVTNICSGIFNGPFGDGCGVRPDIVSGVAQRVPFKGPLDSVNGNAYLNFPAFVDPPVTPNNGFPLHLGSAPRFLPNVRGPFHVPGESFGILKDTQLTERTKLQFRANFFNVFNRTGLGDPDTNVDDGAGSFGNIFGVQNGPRDIMLVLKLEF